MRARFLLPVAVAASTVLIAAPAFASSPRVIATPHTGLVNNQKIHVKVAGFPASSEVTVAQCTRPLTNRGDALDICDMKSLKQLLTNASGAGNTTFVVHTGAVAKQGTCSATSTHCVLVAVSQTSLDQAGVHLHFG
jgi:hypothetical protein